MIGPILRPVNVYRDQGYLIKLFVLIMLIVNSKTILLSISFMYKYVSKRQFRVLNYFNFKLYSRA